MNDSVDRALSIAVLRLLRPLVRILLRHGVPYGSFAELARKAYVEEGFSHIRETQARASDSSVSALTGLTRKETRRLRELEIANDDSASKRYSRAIRVISGWTSDSRFHTGAGAPAVLPLDDSESGFASLVKTFSGDIPPGAMLSVLEASGAVSVDDKGVTLESRAYLPGAAADEKIEILGSDVAELIATIGNNIQSDGAEPFFQRKVSNVSVRADAVSEFRAYSNRKSQQLLEDYHEWLSRHEIDSTADPEMEPSYVAVGIYFSEYHPGEKDEV